MDTTRRRLQTPMFSKYNQNVAITTYHFPILPLLGAGPFWGKGHFWREKHEVEKKTARRKISTCEGSMRGVHARET